MDGTATGTTATTDRSERDLLHGTVLCVGLASQGFCLFVVKAGR